MVLADKIIKLRKQKGWSQEELAEKVGVSRQAVSKWESAQATPDVEKILVLSELFEVSTDYLLKDGREEDISEAEERKEEAKNDLEKPKRTVTESEAKNYVESRKRASVRIALATLLCILSPITMIILSGAVDTGMLKISENLAAALGLVALFIFVGIAVPFYVICGIRNEPYIYLDDPKSFELDNGVSAMLRSMQDEYKNKYIACTVWGVCLCVLSPVPLIIGSFTEREFLTVVLLGVTMAIAGIGVFFFILSGVRSSSLQRLLCEGEFEPKKKKNIGIKETIGFVYWSVLVAVYLLWGFIGNDWHINWIVFAVGGVLFAALMAILNIMIKEK